MITGSSSHQSKSGPILKFSLLWLLIAANCRLRSGATPTPARRPNTQASSDATSSASTIINLTNQNSHLRLSYSGAGIQIPGLYDDFDGHITPIQGKSQFSRLILGLGEDETRSSRGGPSEHRARCHSNSTEEQERIIAAAQNETISLVQFYMASCPDCQGFSPYFKRFSSDIAPHWRTLVRIYTVNCNDLVNIHLCQEENPRLIVPMVRWYVFPTMQKDSIEKGLNLPERRFVYPAEFLNVAHRQFITKQRRDLISLRQATLRFIALTLDELSNDSQKIKLRHGFKTRDHTNSTVSPRRLFYESLPAPWHHLAQLGRNQPEDLDFREQFIMDLNARITRCSKAIFADTCGASSGSNASSLDRGLTVRNFIVFEDRPSFIGRTLVADWSNITCRPSSYQNATQTVIVHRSNDLSFLAGTKLLDQTKGLAKPILATFSVTVTSSDSPLRSMDELNFRVLAWNETQQIEESHPVDRLSRTRRAAQRPRLERVQQRALLEEYYSRLNGGSKAIQPIRYAAAMRSVGSQNGRTLHKREAVGPRPSLDQQAELENANWVPEIVYSGEERLRYTFNQRMVQELANWTLPDLPGALMKGQNPSAIMKPASNGTEAVIDPVTDDLTLMFLTDYYRALDEIVHVDMLSKGDVDGYQLLASCCFLRDLEQHFPFQGNALGSPEIGKRSVARHYVQTLQRAWLDELRTRLRSKGSDQYSPARNGSTRLSVDSMLQQMHEKDGCVRLAEYATSSDSKTSVGDSAAPATNKTVSLEKVHVPSRELEQIQLKIQKTNEVGLPSERHLKWKYCAGSQPYLRGHTCSLWILFHTLTVHEYLSALRHSNEMYSGRGGNQSEPVEYKFQVDYSKPPRRQCDPSNPDGAYLASKTSELFVNQTRFAVANIINFVRYYLPCTNCAAHFSCMVEHSAGLHFDQSKLSPDSHLLWMWEAHNRVNERTRGTHSEDPTRPKHIFPSHGACPQCYIDQPASNATFSSMRFNQAELVNFMVARYRKSSILNNKINIEDMFRSR